MTTTPPTTPDMLRDRLAAREILVAPGVYDALTAALACQAGFGALYVSGAAIAYTRLGRPDIGLVSMAEVADTIAAGDTFSAALLDALWERGLLGEGAAERIAALPRRTLTKVLDHAVRAGALATTRPGADPPYRAEVGRAD